ncbi:hypothetical protein ANANG_G00248120 [Anguilla anguilla]|uniref:Uncharacterized protein n=1 Tax=Anguilla anguilla TaxID=7936 RepID=A0A9D3LVB4_ANGAN|nr:hypothetical protein ANANG_G00248120 [Anguilla anguilla]
MVPMKSMAMPSELLCETVEWQPRNKEEGGRAKNGEDETGDCYSITSVIPSPAENMQQPKSGDQPEEELVLQSPLVSPHTEDSLSNAGTVFPPWSPSES